MAECKDGSSAASTLEGWEVLNGPSSDNSKSLMKQMRDFEKTFKDLREENGELKSFMKSKEARANELSTRLEGKERELERKDIQLKEKCEEMMKKDREIEQLRETIDQQDLQLKKTTLECLESSREMNLKQRKIEELMETKASIEERFVELMKDKSDLTLELNDAKYKINDLTLQVSDCTIEISRLKEKLVKYSEERNRLTDENNRLTEDRDRIASQRNKLAKKLKKISNGSEADESEDEEKQILITQVNAYSRECDKLKGQLQTQVTEHTQSLTSERKNYLRLQKDLKDEKEKHSAQSKELKTLQAELETERGRLLSMTQELKEKSKVHQANEVLVGKMKSLTAEKDRWKTKYDTLDELFSKMEMTEKKDSGPKSPSGEESSHHYYTPHEVIPEQNRKATKRNSDLASNHSTNDETTTNPSQGHRSGSQHGSDDIPENVLIRGIDTEIQYYAGEVRKMSRNPETAEVIFTEDNENDDRPYDPNLVCPKCGKQYRVGEIQKLRRHINEFCTGIR